MSGVVDPGVVQTITGDHNIQAARDVNITNYNLPAALANDWRNLSALADEVRRFWIGNVLEKSTHTAALLALGKEARPDLVENAWERVIELPDSTRTQLPASKPVREIFEDVGRSLLIVGAPGAGKTTTLLELTRDLLPTQPNQPVPVVFSLSTWLDKRQPLHVWLASELALKYHIPKALGSEWLQERRLMLLLDGLDEVAADHRDECVRMIHDFMAEHGAPGLAITCRALEYEQLGGKLRLNGAIHLQPLTPGQVDALLRRGGPELDRLRTLLADDPGLQTLAQTPLMLTVMMSASQGSSLDIAALQRQDTIEERRAVLFDAFVDRMMKRGTRAHMPVPHQLRAWLSWLATRMRASSQTEFLIEQLQPEWLHSKRSRAAYIVLTRSLPLMLLWISVLVPLNMLSGGFFGSSLRGTALISLLPAAILFVLEYRAMSRAPRERQPPAFFRRVGRFLVYPWAMIAFNIWWVRRGRTWDSDIKLAEHMVWSSRNALRHGARGALIGVGTMMTLMMGTCGVIGGRSGLDALPIALLAGAALGLMYGVPIGAVAGMITGFVAGWGHVKRTELRIRPMQGILRSVRNSVSGGALAGLGVGTVSIAVYYLIVRELTTPPLFVLYLAWMAFMLGFLWCGGVDVISHYVLRLLLWRSGVAPARYIRFLDNCADLILLQKVGGSYRFVHGLFRDHIATRREPLLVREGGKRAA